MNLFFNKISPLFLQAQAEVSKGLDERVNEWFQPLADAWGSFIFYPISFTEEVQVPAVVIMLVLSATIFTLVFKFVNIRLFGTAIQIVRGKYDNLDHHEALPSEGMLTKDGDIMGTAGMEGKHGEVSHFQALTAALSGTVGLGNIAGVAIAVSIGGPGATFWMIVAGLLGMSAKFVECTLGVKYRDIDENGVVYGGPMYYLSKGLASMGLKIPGQILAGIFAVMCIGGSFGGGNMFQANQAAQQFNTLFGFESSSAGVIFGVIMAAIVALVILGGIKSIASVTERIVPFMVGMYMIAAIVIVVMHIGSIGEAFSEIFSGAFAPESIAGGVIGVLIQGFKRAAFSNESGIGSAAIAHSAVKTRYAASEGLVSLLEPFIDTVIVCTMTALVIVFCNTDGSIMTYGTKAPDGVLATSKAFATVFPWFPYLLTIAVILFAFSTMISWSYYGLQSWMYLFGKSKFANYSYKFIFCVFVVIGSASSLSAVTDFSDAMIFAMAVPNLIGCFLLLPKVKEELERYLSVIQHRRM